MTIMCSSRIACLETSALVRSGVLTMFDPYSGVNQSCSVAMLHPPEWPPPKTSRGEPAEPSFERKLFCDAHACISVPSTVKRSSLMYRFACECPPTCSCFLCRRMPPSSIPSSIYATNCARKIFTTTCSTVSMHSKITLWHLYVPPKTPPTRTHHRRVAVGY